MAASVEIEPSAARQGWVTEADLMAETNQEPNSGVKYVTKVNGTRFHKVDLCSFRVTYKLTATVIEFMTLVLYYTHYTSLACVLTWKLVTRGIDI